ncbi:MAG TPA: lytic transglycosylase domain-containing protein, partial [Geminicoccaceae bacterium]|nr:lytic transglycosylase domain-containing protein [Geminicoccaceae bacterium]
DLVTEAVGAARQERWAEAERLAAQSGEPLAITLIAWMRLAYGRERAGVDTLRRFLEANPHWPEPELLRRRAEEAIADPIDAAALRAFFADRPPLTRQGRTRYAQALLIGGDRELAARWLRTTWIEDDFSRGNEREFHLRYGGYLTERDHIARLHRLLWDGRWLAAEWMYPRVPKDQRALAQARIRLQRGQGGVDAAIAAVPRHLQDDPGLVYDRIRWRRNRGRDDGAVELLLQPAVAEVGRANLWWVERELQARRALARGDYRLAYDLASRHRQEGGLDFAEAEWLAGWIALRFIGRPNEAFAHFERLWDGVATPISRARAAYWAGRAAAALGDRPAAASWYREAAQHWTTYYGQLAAFELGEPPTAPPPPPDPGPERRAAFDRLELVRMARLLMALGARDELDLFVLRLADHALTLPDYQLVADLAAEAGRPDLMVRVSKRAYYRNLVIESAGYPVVEIDGLVRPAHNPPEPALLLAIARQESQFDGLAVSTAGARGLLQLMPGTAKGVAERLGEPFSLARLGSDPEYNARLGAHYLRMQLSRFDGDLVLALAAYNAGPQRVSEWLRRNGDPRRGDAARVIDWVELIPFSETRNYVQRVIEGRAVYERRLTAGAVRPVALEPHAGPLLPAPLPRFKPRVRT